MFYFFPFFVLLSLFKSFPSVFFCVRQIFLVFEENTLQYLKKIQTKRLLRKFLGSLTQRAHHEALLNFVSGFSAMARRIFGAGSSFRVGWRTAGGGGGLDLCFSGFFRWYWRRFHFGGGAGRWAIVLWGLDTFLIFPNFLRPS